MSRVLHVSKELSFPPDFVTSTAVIYGGKGMGKTNLGSVLVEELAGANLKFSWLDAPGVAWGLRFDVSGKGPGIEVLILGGVHGDIPIEPTGGAVVADLVADEDASVIIDISRRPDGTMWSIAERVRFVTDYCKRLYQRQGEKRRPVMQVIDEAARFIPQIVRQGEQQVAACMGAIATLVEEGRNVGIGVTLITQRSARLNKDVAELADAMISFRTVGPNSRRAVLDWLGEHVEKKRIKEMDEQLRALPRGSALVVSPGWLEFEGVVSFRARRTFDSSATPKPGEAAKKVSGGAKPDLGKYAERMKDTIERAANNDPRVLQKRVAELQAQVKKLEAAKVPAAKTVIKEVYVLKEGQLKRIEAASERARQAGADFMQAAKTLAETIAPAMQPPPAMMHGGTTRSLHKEDYPGPGSGLIAPRPPPPRSAPQRPHSAPAGDPPATDNGELSAYAMDLVRTLAEREPMKLTRGQLAALSGKSARSSLFDGSMAKLRKAGLIASEGNRIVLTDQGRALSGVAPGTTATTPEELREAWLKVLPDYERDLLGVLFDWPNGITREQLAKLAGKGLRSSAFDGALASLRRNGLIVAYGNVLLAAPELLK